MGLLGSLSMLLPLLLWVLWMPAVRAQLPGDKERSARSLDALLQDYAFRAFPSVHPRTGTLYAGEPPSNLTGIKISAMRLRSGSLRTRGVKSYWEFEMPKGVVVQPYVERLVLVYQNLGKWSFFYYPIPGYTYLTPIVGLLAYDAFNLSSTNLPELDITAPINPISIKFSGVQSAPSGLSAKCIWFDLEGVMKFSNITSDNICSATKQGHFSIVAEYTAAPSPSPVSPQINGGPNEGPSLGGGESKVWKIVGSVLGGFVLLVLLSLLVLWVQRYKHQKKMQQMEKASEVGEALHIASIGNTRAPMALGTRTQPVLENEYVP
ncbi:PREDICTED: uncharacterized protein LOC104586718 [Nelumbo nucifera]|uniref:Uncharacterized protein LOC104586718 n=2 Tax=Nelumbo nucifera TaxID=4432 RepID=A0A1U7Z4P0_NELNU|nr:PREDICTED: uncharacterized protein LOC104586718 [Nelumbo nucifera]DAD31138.1 TPA_asm: hypothetical protein HUJ06_009989 [Nelumbo nucifera]